MTDKMKPTIEDAMTRRAEIEKPPVRYGGKVSKCAHDGLIVFNERVNGWRYMSYTPEHGDVKLYSSYSHQPFSAAASESVVVATSSRSGRSSALRVDAIRRGLSSSGSAIRKNQRQ